MRLLTVVVLLVLALTIGCKKQPSSAGTPLDSKPGGSGAGTNQPAPATQVTTKDLDDVRLLIDQASGVSGQMPPPKLVSDILQQSGSPAADLVKKGLVVIPPARTREDIWAYEAKALEQGGLVVTSNGVDQMSSAELKRRLGK